MIESASPDVCIDKTQIFGNDVFVVRYLGKVRYYSNFAEAIDHVSKFLYRKDREELVEYIIKNGL